MRSGDGSGRGSRGPRSSSTCLGYRTSRRQRRASLGRGRRAREPSPPNLGARGDARAKAACSGGRPWVYWRGPCAVVRRGAWSYGRGRRNEERRRIWSASFDDDSAVAPSAALLPV